MNGWFRISPSLFLGFLLAGVLSADAVEYRARRQPTVPDSWKEVPFVETVPAPALTPEEKARGFLLFQRPIMEPVFPNTHPRPGERLHRLTAFATPGEFEPLTFSIYPVRKLENLRVRISPLVKDGDEIPAADLDVRLLTYWNVAYPRYSSRSTYRRTPELLERVTVHSSPANECQRWWITVHAPTRAKAGIYRGTVSLWDDRTPEPVRIPVAFRVLDFPLRSDPHKHYSTYYICGNRVQFKGRDSAFVERAIGNEIKTMVDLGIDVCPTLYVRYDRKNDKLHIAHIEEVERMLAAGMKGPVPLAGGNEIGALYRMMVPDGKIGSHGRITKMPPPEFFAKLTNLYHNLEEERRKNGWPELICCPLDEEDPQNKEYGARVFRAVRAGGIRTYITKDPTAADAVAYRDAVDAWCSQPYSMPYEKVVAQTQYEYWSYPNHNSGEIKDRRVMCKGGRMTYGFGFWRSGYTMLMPWNWAWTPGPDQFDYLRGRRSGCGQRIDDDASVIPAVYWHCFREGCDDERYLYTLQQAIWEREGSTDAACRRATAAGKAILQRMWDDIQVQQKYLADNMWPSAEFNARRWRLALAIRDVLSFPAVRRGQAPSVLVDRTRNATPTRENDADFIAKAIARGLVEEKDLGEDFSQWVAVGAEGKVSVTPAAGRDGKPGLRWRVTVDHKTDGEHKNGKYPVGWPRVYRSFAKSPLNLADYDYLMFMMRVDSNRDEVADDTTPVGFTLHSNGFYEVVRDLGGRQRVWIPVLFPIQSLMATINQGEDPWKAIGKAQFFISERRYADGTQLTFDVADVKLLRFKTPMIRAVEAPAFVMLPQDHLRLVVTCMGPLPRTRNVQTIKAELLNGRGTLATQTAGDLFDGTGLLLDTGNLSPGTYRLRVALQNKNGASQSQIHLPVECMPGPFWGMSPNP